MVTSVSYIANKLMGMFEGKNEYIESLNSYPLLVLDDLGAERNTEYMNEVVYTIINARYKAKLPLIVTTNLTTEQLKAPTDVTMARTYSRVLEMCFPIKVEGVDIRREKARNEYKTMSDILGL
jgi:DNA replication protein DnaC